MVWIQRCGNLAYDCDVIHKAFRWLFSNLETAKHQDTLFELVFSKLALLTLSRTETIAGKGVIRRRLVLNRTPRLGVSAGHGG